MVYCKYCGMESSNPNKCEWCGRSFTPTAPMLPPTPPVRTVGEVVEAAEETEHKARAAFFTSCGILVVLASCLIAWRFTLYPYVAGGGLFVTGILLRYFRILPTFDFNEWIEFVVPLALLIVFPALLVLLGYVVYGLVTREMDLTVVWLLSVYFGFLTIIQVVTIIAGPERISFTMWLQFRGVEILGLLAIIFGWVVGSSLTTDG